MEFRTIKAEEIDLRVGTVVEDKGVSLLCYKDARVDMNILDETVGVENWQREHYEVKGNLFCRVGIRTEDGWVWKSDCGTESNTEKEKGEASDSFKRACFNFGIGRELYTAPFIWIPLSAAEFEPQKNSDKKKLKGSVQKAISRFKVSEIGYNEKKEIIKLVIVDKSGTVVYKYEA